MSEVADLWTQCQALLQAQVSEAVWSTTFANLVFRTSDPGELVLLAPSSVVLDRLQNRFGGLIRDVVSAAGGEHLRVSFEVQAQEPEPPEVPQAVDEPVDGHAVAGAATAPGRTDDRAGRKGDSPLNVSYSFDNFVIGENNRFPHAAARSVAETPARSWNPLFIHGGAGLGKTHLLHAIGNYVAENYPSYRVKYVTTEAFLNEFVEMIRTSTGPQFRKRYREVDVLLIDDIQFLEGKEGLQEEFFWTFNHLYQAQSQIVLTCDRDPKSIATLEDRLRTRLLQGLVADIQPPNLETRLAILRKRAERESIEVPEDVMTLIADAVKDNIRELEGALTRVIAFASLTGNPVKLDEARSILADVLEQGEPRRITPQLILDTTAKQFGYTVEELRSEARTRPLVTARQIGMYAFRELTEFSYPSIAKEFGGRDHTTVIHAVKKIEQGMKERQAIYDQVTELLQTIRGGD